MRFLHTFLSVLIFVVVGGWAHAQTPTPHPNALPVGMYQFEDLSSPEIELTGTNWSISVQNFQDVLRTNHLGDTLTFRVLSNADYVVISRAKSSGVSGWEVCVDSNPCEDISDRGSSGMEMATFQLYESNSEVVITKTDSTNYSYFDFMQIVLDPDSIQAVSGTTPETSPTATPEAYYIFGTVTGVSGTVPTRFDMVVTAGDVGITNALLFLFFSIWAIIFIIYFVSRNRV